MRIFKTWRHKGIQYLAFPHNTGIMVFDEFGGNYGAWQKLSNFKKKQSKEESLALESKAILNPFVLNTDDFGKFDYDAFYQ